MPAYHVQLRATQDRSGKSVVVADSPADALAFLKESLVLKGLTLVVEPKDNPAEEPLVRKWNLVTPQLFSRLP